ncbi:MAG: GNAT family N-acetyltransferase [candidate division Zixibacteria bacterium]|nr:GNAT family N-acetyltransferase [candidate division Zixibacteria bacterium]
MRIIEITESKDLDLMLSIVKTYPRTDKEMESTEKQLNKELSEAGGNRHLYVGYKNDICVAMIQLILKNADNDPDLADSKKIAHVHNLQVRQDLQGNGIGRTMMDFIEDKAREMGIKVLTLGVDDVNKRAIKMYKNRGYETFKTEPGRYPGEFGYCMKKTL